MNYVNVVVLPRPHNVEFKCVGRLIFDINYMEYTSFETKMWLNSKGQAHCENGPAVIWEDGYQCWYRYGELHCEDGPARIWNKGRQYWCLNGIEYSEEDFHEEITRRNELRESKNLTETTQY